MAGGNSSAELPYLKEVSPDLGEPRPVFLRASSLELHARKLFASIEGLHSRSGAAHARRGTGHEFDLITC